MAWIQLHIASNPQFADHFQDALESLGATAVTLTDGANQPVFEPPPGSRPLWQTTVVTALFSDETDMAAILASLAKQGLHPDDHRLETLAEQSWERAWMDSFHPMQFGQRLWIVPSWTAPPEPDAVNLKLDPGLAFGTGTHETTALCLEWLDTLSLSGCSVLDMGCGSGVLAIAALLLGAGDARATDIDDQALTASRANAESNGVAGNLSLYRPHQLPDDYQCDVLVANILAAPLIDMAADLAHRCRPGARMALSGILAEQADSVRRAYGRWFQLETPVQRGDWVCIRGTRRPH